MAAKTKAAKAPAKTKAKAPAPAAKKAPVKKPAAKSSPKPVAKVAAKAAPKAVAKAKPPAKPAKPVAKAKPAAKAKPVAKGKVVTKAKPAAKTVAKAKPAAKTVAKAKPKSPAAKSPAKTVAKAGVAKQAVNTVKSITKAIAGMVKGNKPVEKAPTPPTANAKTATAIKKPATSAVKVATASAPASKSKKADSAAAASGTDAPRTPGNTMKASVTKGKAAPTGADEGTRARAVKPSRPAAPQEPLTAPSNQRVDLPAGYKPKSGEEYMSPLQLEYFRQKLINWRAELVEESKQTIDNLREEVRDVGDEAERATRETENSLELRTRDRYRKLISKIEKALKRVDDGSYGYCEETGEEIGIDRLEARPIATLCLDAQERWEHRQKLMGD